MNKTDTVAVACDHGGYELKKRYLNTLTKERLNTKTLALFPLTAATTRTLQKRRA